MSHQCSDDGYSDDDKEFVYEDSDDGIDMNSLEDDDDFEDDDHHLMAFQPIQPESEKKRDYQVDFKVLGPQQISQMQTEEIEQVSMLCELSKEHAALLLRHFKWNKEKLIERYMEKSEAVLMEAGIVQNDATKASSSDSSIGGFQPAPVGFCCDICCGEEDGQAGMQTLTLPCSHRFCSDCYTHYLTIKINNGESRNIQCPGSGCKIAVDEAVVRIAVTGKVLSRYYQALNRSFVDDSEFMRWCPAPNCENVLECHVRRSELDRIVPTVSCKCGHIFCFGCLGADHRPAVCSLVKKWRRKCADDSETANWISAHTKECSKCGSTIEKNGGCNHMTCKKCKYEFCWVCMGPWSEHGNGFYNCNRFDEKSSKEARDVQAKSRAQLERYLHYFNRYANHEQSAKLANDFYYKTEKKMEEMQLTTEFSWIEVQFMKKALQVVLDCRHTLTWTYALAFYLKPGNLTALFEDNQRDLEMAVETLNELIERPIPEPDDPEQKQKMADLKKQVLDKTEYCSRRREVLLSDTCRGLQESRWQFIGM